MLFARLARSYEIPSRGYELYANVINLLEEQVVCS